MMDYEEILNKSINELKELAESSELVNPIKTLCNLLEITSNPNMMWPKTMEDGKVEKVEMSTLMIEMNKLPIFAVRRDSNEMHIKHYERMVLDLIKEGIIYNINKCLIAGEKDLKRRTIEN